MSRRRKLLFVVAGILLLLLALPLVMSLQTSPPPPLDPKMTIRLSDGTDSTLEEVVARAAGPPAKLPPAPEPTAEDSTELDLEPTPNGVIDRITRTRVRPMTYEDYLRMYGNDENPNDLFRMAGWAELNGRTEEAAALLRSLPEDHEHYARGMRMLGWDLYANQLQDPTQGIYFVNKSLMASPFEGNAWQDAYRIYWQSVTN